MKKIIINSVFFIFFSLLILIIILSTIGIETDKFNESISNRISQKKNIDLKLEKIHFKIDPKKFSLFLETKNPKINYRGLLIPITNAKVYIDFISIFKSETKIKKTSLAFEELDVASLSKYSSVLKPSNFKNLLSNKIKKGKLTSEIDIFLYEDNSLKNFIAKGKIRNLEAEIFSDLHLSKTNLSFFADKNDILLKNIFGELDDIKISDGDIKLNLEDGLKLKSNFISKLSLKENFFIKHKRHFKRINFFKKITSLEADLNNNFFIDFDDTLKMRDFSYSLQGKIKKNNLEIENVILNKFLTEEINKIYFSDLDISAAFAPKQFKLKSNGKYSFNNLDFFKINLSNDINDKIQKLDLNLEYNNTLKIDLLNYQKPLNTIANFSLNLEKKDNKIDLKSLNYLDGKNKIKISNLILRENKISSFKKISVLTNNNDFFVENNKKILIKGKKFDATNLAKLFNNKKENNQLEKINGSVEIDFKNIKIPMSETLKNFRLIGEIKKGKFVKIISKGEFGGGNYLDISMKKNKNNDKKFLEIYSDLPKPLLTEYSFFNGLSGGKLLFSSIIDNSNSSSILKIEDFKVVNAPGVVKLLSLADLGGLADLAEGEGLTFDILEINMEKNKDFLKINEILALGPSMSVLMEGYQDKNGLTSLRGTLVPAKTLNKMISKIPVIGNIIIPKEVGEGLFGVSFKIKGPKGKIKTTINPIKTLTPRFIQKILENKKTK